MHSFYTIAELDGVYELIRIKVDEIESPTNPAKRFYNLNDFEIANKKPFAVNWGLTPSTVTNGCKEITSAIFSVSDLFRLVKAFDKNFNPKPASKVVYKDGPPQIVYCIIPENINVFDKEMAAAGTFGKYSCFTEDRYDAIRHLNAGENAKMQLREVYLRITNPLDMNESAEIQAWKKALRRLGKAEIEFKGVKTNEDAYAELLAQLEKGGYTKFGAFKFACTVLEEMGYDGIMQTKDGVRMWNVLNPEQVKAVDNVGFFDSENPDMRYSMKKLPDINGVLSKPINQEPGFGHAQIRNITEILKKQSVDSISYLTDNEAEKYMNVGNKHVQNKKFDIIQQGEKVILTSKKETDDFIDRSLSGENFHQIKAFSKVTDRMVADIKNVGNLDVSDYYLELNSSDILHTVKHLEEETRKNQIPLSVDDIRNLPEYIVNYDDVLEVNIKRDGRKTVIFGKKINGHSIIITVVSSGRKSLALKTAFVLDTKKYNELYGKQKEDVSHREATATNNEAMPDTSETVPSATSSINRISQNKPKDNPNPEKSYEQTVNSSDELNSLKVIPAIFDEMNKNIKNKALKSIFGREGIIRIALRRRPEKEEEENFPYNLSDEEFEEYVNRIMNQY